MKSLALWIALALLALGALQLCEALPYLEEDNAVDDYTNDLERLLQNAAQKRSCIRRGSSCEHRPGDCCANLTCRCNLWGTNCRCQRMGLFQKWGRK
ncbi:U8-agatoxin-Ao1a-like [Hetaerina americana]|uniref:U8-agatoxin-Ao1a-like n=1 Tax=Hetaerina americana TaxID=62018 RepID=UPI003A7F3D04